MRSEEQAKIATGNNSSMMTDREISKKNRYPLWLKKEQVQNGIAHWLYVQNYYKACD